MIALSGCRALIVGVAALLATGLPGGVVAEPGAGSSSWTWPLEPEPRVVRTFEPPPSPYGPGHRGVDLAGYVGQQVLAIGDGIVSFSGQVGGRDVVVVDHGRLRSTYQPVTPFLPVGTVVSAGQVIGLLEALHSHCLPEACLHLGVRRGDSYLDPLSLLGARPIRLKPLGGLPVGSVPSPLPDDAEREGSALAWGRLAPSAGAVAATVGVAAGQARG